MKIIPRRVHGVLDYLVGLLLVLAPRLFGLAPGPESSVLVTLGWLAIIYSLLTRYELGLIKLLPFRAHLGIDAVHGLVLAASPWLFGFSHRVWLPHVVLGLMEMGVVLLSRPTEAPAPSTSNRAAASRQVGGTS